MRDHPRAPGAGRQPAKGRRGLLARPSGLRARAAAVLDALPELAGSTSAAKLQLYLDGRADTALARASPSILIESVREFTHHLDDATLRQVTSRLERTRIAVLALRNAGQVPLFRPRARRSRF